MASIMNMNIWINHYIKIGKNAENPFNRPDTRLFDKYMGSEIQEYESKIIKMRS